MSSFVKATATYQQGQRTLPGRYYTSQEIYAEEQERIFTARWICVGRAADADPARREDALLLLRVDLLRRVVAAGERALALLIGCGGFDEAGHRVKSSSVKASRVR